MTQLWCSNDRRHPRQKSSRISHHGRETVRTKDMPSRLPSSEFSLPAAKDFPRLPFDDIGNNDVFIRTRMSTSTTKLTGYSLSEVSLTHPTSHSASEQFHPGSTVDRTITIDGVKRSYSVHTPKSWDGKTPLPVEYYFNGVNPNFQEKESFTGLSKVADAKDVLVVYLHGTGRLHAFNNGQGVFNLSGSNLDENKYLNAVHDQLSSLLPLDRRRQGLAGFSEGGSEAYALAPKNTWVSSVQSVEGYMTGLEPVLNRPISEQSIHALHDTIVPISGTPQMDAKVENDISGDLHGRNLKSIPGQIATVLEDAVEHVGHNYIEPEDYLVNTYIKANRITKAPQMTRNRDVVTYDYINAKTNQEVKSIVLTNPFATHGWAGSTDHSGDIKVIGIPDPHYNASEAIIDFLLDHKNASAK